MKSAQLKVTSAAAATAAMFLFLASPSKADITYDLNFLVGFETVSGTMTTDGKIGPLNVTDISHFSISLSDGGGSQTIDSTTAFRSSAGTGFNATATGLFFDFSQDAKLLFENGGGPFLCFNGVGQTGCVFNLPQFLVISNTVSGTFGIGHTDNFQFATAEAVPGPIVGAGLPGAIMACGGLLGWWRRKRKAEAAV